MQHHPRYAGSFAVDNTLCVMSDSAGPTAKVLFRVPEEDGSAQAETLWAFDLGNDEYKIDNSPFYAYSVSWQDVVYAPFSSAEECPTFVRVLQKSGNRTVRVIFDEPLAPGNKADQVLKGLQAIGCDFEGANRRLISINIPAKVELSDVATYLVGESVEWEHADPSYMELYEDDA
jgi:hypothetical protein